MQGKHFHFDSSLVADSQVQFNNQFKKKSVDIKSLTQNSFWIISRLTNSAWIHLHKDDLK